MSTQAHAELIKTLQAMDDAPAVVPLLTLRPFPNEEDNIVSTPEAPILNMDMQCVPVPLYYTLPDMNETLVICGAVIMALLRHAGYVFAALHLISIYHRLSGNLANNKKLFLQGVRYHFTNVSDIVQEIVLPEPTKRTNEGEPVHKQRCVAAARVAQYPTPTHKTDGTLERLYKETYLPIFLSIFNSMMVREAINQEIPGAVYDENTDTFIYKQSEVDSLLGRSPAKMTDAEQANYTSRVGIQGGGNVTKRDFLGMCYMLFFNGLYIPGCDDGDLLQSVITEALITYNKLKKFNETSMRIGCFLIMSAAHYIVKTPTVNYPTQICSLLSKFYAGITEREAVDYYPPKDNMTAKIIINEQDEMHIVVNRCSEQM
eukprot:GHVR01023762.1.p1 GENE.GHVR01023762.1~~GHVR01023762.1.p1  ORF type:complete len:373 (+),score=56.82 GHVR01023762.1:507-1625(+)